ncbi:NUDIX hydrolase [Sphaerisporangium melleum]|uniref:NUDIX hydrolase n=1 Tax=Sphaerisporangium melleum TaxID=321316 RepID=A0A917QXP3_9ACTN|nr:NUDIX domain-containing protein [Sphaerisporangium melleum]GGK74055.1 NUDIX hydrolase [Sphaerisporangium melleum]GII70869.1 NUDIX hydrolase [Sphaerisporangium melleum]
MTERTRRVDYWQDLDAPKPTSRKASASVFVQDDAGRLLLLRRTDNDLWTIPTGGIKKGETVAQCAVRECREETGLTVEIIGLVGVFSDPGHVIVYLHGDKVDEVRQPINVCLRAKVVAGEVQPDPREAQEVRWIAPTGLDTYRMHPAIKRRIDVGLRGGDPYIE